MSLSISGKTAIVTGAANGVGLAIARHFVDKGANVMFADMDDEALTRKSVFKKKVARSVRLQAICVRS